MSKIELSEVLAYVGKSTPLHRTIFFLALHAVVAVPMVTLSDVVPTDAPALVLKRRTIADVQANEISGDAIGAHMRPRNLVGFNKTVLPSTDGKPERLRVEMQMMDSYHLKCIVLELSDGVDGVLGRAVAARYVLTKDRESQGRGSLVGCRLWGHTESDTIEAT